MSKRYSLAEVAAEHLPPWWTDGERWLARRLKSGELRGMRYGRTWVMRDSDIEHMLCLYFNQDKTSPQPEPAPEPKPLCVADGLSERSRRRLRAAS